MEFIFLDQRLIIITQIMINRSCQIVQQCSRLFSKNIQCSSTQKDLINAPSSKLMNNREALKQNTWRDLDVTGTKSQTTHLSNAEQLIREIPVVKVTSDVVRCMGGTVPGAGHPQVYIQVNTRNPGEPVACKYCGIQYALDLHHHH